MRLAFALTLAAAPALAQGLDGDDSLEAARCGDPSSDGGVAGTGAEIASCESRCAIENPVAPRGMDRATLFDARCTGEGESWGYRLLAVPSAEGDLVLVREGSATTDARCR